MNIKICRIGPEDVKIWNGTGKQRPGDFKAYVGV